MAEGRSESPRPDLHPVPDDASFDTPVAARAGDAPEGRLRLVPRSVAAALCVVGLEVVAMLLGLAFLVSTMAQDAQTDVRLTVATLVFLLAMATVLVFAGFATLRRRRWGRAPLLTWQLLQSLVVYPSLSSNAWPLAVVLLGLSVAGLVALLAPPTTRYLGDDSRRLRS